MLPCEPMTFERLDKLYAVVDPKTRMFMFIGPPGLISVFSNLREAHRVAAQINGIVVRCRRLDLYDEPIGLNGKKLKHA